MQSMLTASAAALVSPDGTGRLPAMGWNSWNEYGCDINEEVFVKVAELMKSLGLKDLGYEYVNIDDCWSDKVKRRDNVTHQLIPDYEKFPKGIRHVADRVHELGLKLGIYGDAGEYERIDDECRTCHSDASRNCYMRWLCRFAGFRRD